MDRYTIPSHLDDPELIGFWTLDEFLAMAIPFVWGILAQHIVIGLMVSMLGWRTGTLRQATLKAPQPRRHARRSFTPRSK